MNCLVIAAKKLYLASAERSAAEMSGGVGLSYFSDSHSIVSRKTDYSKISRGVRLDNGHTYATSKLADFDSIAVTHQNAHIKQTCMHILIQAISALFLRS